jgi:DNA sulfur modification protein DndD
MKFNSIILENFGPFFGENEIELSTSSGSPIILFNGENMRGKTTLLRAFRWCLYGKVKGHDNKSIPETDFANWDARDSGKEFRTSIKIEIATEVEVLTVIKWFTAKQSEISRESVVVTDQGWDCFSSISNAVPREDIENKINSLLHEDISEFFLFDGEALTGIEAKLRSDLSAGDFVKDSIEKALGLPALTTIEDDLEFLRREANRELQELVKVEGAAKELLDSIDVLDDKIKTGEEQILKLDEMLVVHSRRRAEIEPIIQANFTMKEKFEKRDELESELTDLANKADYYVLQISERLNRKFWLPNTRKIAVEKAKVQNEIDLLNTDLQQFARESAQRATLIASIEHGKCDNCNQEISAAVLTQMKDELHSLEQSIGDIAVKEDGLQKLKVRKSILSGFEDSAADLEIIENFDAQLRQSLIRIQSKKSELSDLKKTLESVNEDFESIDTEYSIILSALQDIKAAKPAVLAALEDARAKREDKNRELASLQRGNTPVKQRIAILDHQIKIFRESINRFRDLMRMEVQEEATKIFRRLTSEPDYAGLRINSKYYLQIVDNSDRIIQRRSAGAEQIVAMSLIGALIQCSVKDAPVIMDTPLGRLDTTHRKNIMKWIPEMAGQVMLFVTSTEFSNSVDRPLLGSSIGREYWLKRISPTRTEIRKNSDG